MIFSVIYIVNTVIMDIATTSTFRITFIMGEFTFNERYRISRY